MKHGQLLKASTGALVKAKLMSADSLWERSRGLLGRQRISAEEGLLILPCSGIHTIGMSYALDVIFLDSQSVIIFLVQSLKPWRFAGPINRAQCVVEMAAGSIVQSNLAIGDQLEIKFGTEY